MSVIFAVFLTSVALVAIFYAYSNIRQGGARVYTLEREVILRRATAAMFFGTALLVGTIALLIIQGESGTREILDTEEALTSTRPTQNGDVLIPAPPPAETGSESGSSLPALETVTPTPTIDPGIPTATPTPIVVRGFVSGTGGNGLYMRTTPGGEQITILQEDEFVTVLEEEGRVEQNGITWVKVRSFLGDEGWVAIDFLEIEGN